MKHQRNCKDANIDPIINAYIDILRNKYLEFREPAAPQGAEAKLLSPYDLEDPKYYFVTARYNLPPWMIDKPKEPYDPKNLFKKNNIPPSHLHYSKTIPYVYRHSKLLHNHICNKIVKKHFRPKNLGFLPLSLSFVDFGGSKERNFRLHEMAHTHSIYLLHPSTIEAFDELNAKEFRLSYKATVDDEVKWLRYDNTVGIQSVDVQEIANTRTDLYRTLSYASKFHLSPFNQRLDYETRVLSFDAFNKLK